MSNGPVIVWFRQDLRLADHPALRAAAASGRAVLPVFIGNFRPAAPYAPGRATRWWLHGSLERLDAGLREFGSRLILRQGEPLEVLARLVDETGASALYWSRCYEPGEASQEACVRDRLGATLELRRFAGRLLFEPEALRTGAGRPFQVFTPFWKACLALPEPPAPAPVPSRIEVPATWPAGEALASWRLLPTRPDWAGGLRAAFTPGEAAAIDSLGRFLDGPVEHYRRDRDRPGIAGTSRLSPHLHFGEISPRQIWHAVRMAALAGSINASEGEAFLRELVWREFAAHLLFHWPDMPAKPLRPEFSAFPWAGSAAQLRAWRRGETGYPIVDAGMRELWTTGWMHNRVRMVVASFLIKHLLIPWQDGEAWFWDTLVDADLANNAVSWQWVAGCGADAAPYFRIFNPVLQGLKFDGDGQYVRRWVPELARLPGRYLHCPWEAPTAELDAAGIKLGRAYPLPIVEHQAARARALAAFASIRGSA